MHSIDNLSELGDDAEKRSFTGMAVGAGLYALSKGRGEPATRWTARGVLGAVVVVGVVLFLNWLFTP